MNSYPTLSIFFFALLLCQSCSTNQAVQKSGQTKIDQGYGEVDASKNTTAISQSDVSNEDSSRSWMELLQRTSGVTVSGSDNDLSIQIRGKKSMTASNEPLFVVDDRIMGNGFHNVSFINPGLVKRISILKDAAASSAYGSRGADGVILITLK